MNIKRFIGGTLESNGYVICHRTGGDCYIIDPGYSPQKFIKYVAENKLNARGIILTHLHHDHVGGAKVVHDALGCPVYMHEADAFVYRGDVDVKVSDGFTFDLEGETLTVISTPGHTKGSICIYSDKSKICFTGDTLFDTDLGRSDLAGGSEADMKHSVCDIIDKWSNEITIYPGHDDGCTMKMVRKYNTEFNALRDGHER